MAGLETLPDFPAHPPAGREQALMAASPEAIVIVDADGIIREFSPAAERTFGHTRERAVGSPVAELLIPPDLRGRHRDGLRLAGQESARELAHRRLETTALCADGTEIPVELTISRIEGEQPLLIAFVRDLSEQRRAQADQQRLASIVASSEDSIISASMEGTILSFSPGAARLYGYSAEEMAGRHLSTLVPPGHRRLVADLQRSALTGERGDERCEALTADGRQVHVRISVSPLRQPGGRVVGTSWITRDISDRVASEQRIRAYAHEREVILNSIGEGVLQLDPHGCITFANPRACEALGYSPQELLGQPMHALVQHSLADGSAYPWVQSPICDCLQRGETRRADEVFWRKDGSCFEVEYISTPTRDGDRATGAVCMFGDVSTRRREERQLREQLRLQEMITRAIAERRLLVYSQPIVDLDSAQTMGEELLVRMRGEDGSIMSPAEFLVPAERLGLIGVIDRWMITQATDLAASGRTVQVNVSARSVLDTGLTAHIEAELHRAGADPGRLLFEITETAAVDDLEAFRGFAHRVEALGCSLALDDFGTGYASFTLLRNLPVRYLKIDMSFVRNLHAGTGDRSVVEAIVGLARSFGQKTIAEGVEEQRTLAILRDCGVDLAQGYLLGRPARVESSSPPVDGAGGEHRQPAPK